MSAEKGMVSRRSFVKGLTAASLGVSLCHSGTSAAVPLPAPEKWDEEADVIVVGAGGAGSAAALTAVENNLKVIVLEKLPLTGGSSTICGGATAWAGTDMQQAEKIKDSEDVFIKDMMTVGGGVNDPELVKAYVGNGLDTYKWLKASGVEFLSVGVASGMSVPRVHYTHPSQVLKALNDRAKAKGAKFVLRAAVENLLADKTGRVVGVRVKQGSKIVNYRAKKGVLLASGGFALNKKYYAKFVPTMKNAKAMVGLGSDGDGLRMAWAYGADIADMPYIKATFGFDTEPESMADFVLTFYFGGIIVNKEGKRFCDESKSYKLVGDAALMQKDAVGIQIFDAAVREKAQKDTFGKTDKLEAKGRLIQADTLEELAKKLGIDPTTFVATVKEYNANVDKGTDPLFRRSSLTSGYGELVKIEKAPFYGFPSTAVILATYGGITVNPKAEVTDVFEKPIPGLYAAGEITGGVHGAAYMTGTAFGKALVFGRLAVKTMVA